MSTPFYPGVAQQRAKGPDTVTGAAARGFLKHMIPHHQDAVDMSRKYLSAADADRHPAVDDLARRIASGQAKEIDKMRAWLDSGSDDYGYSGNGDGDGDGDDGSGS